MSTVRKNTSPDADQENSQPLRARRLGRGLNALIGGGDEPAAAAIEMIEPSSDPADPNSQTGQRKISVEQIDRNPFQPRKHFEEAPLNELVESIRQHGVLQPLLVRPFENGFQLIAGERRLLASRQAGLETVPCQVLDLDDQKVCEAAIEENLKRKDLNVLEKAQAFQDYIDRFNCSIEKLAKNLSMSRPAVSNMLRLLELPELVQQFLIAGKITEGHARSLLRLEEQDQLVLCKHIEAKSLNVRETEAAVRSILDRDKTIPFDQNPKPPKPTAAGPTSHVLSLQNQLRDQLGAKVEIKLSGKESGKIVIQFGSNDDFERIIRFLRPAA